MTAHEEQDERVVLLRPTFDIYRRGELARLQGCGGFPAPAGNVAARVIRHAPRGHLNQPAARIVGNSFLRPLNSRRE